MTSPKELTEISVTELEQVSGGARARQQHSNLFGRLGVRRQAVGGKQLAQRLYGRHTSAADEARAQAAMKKFLVGGNKLPKGVPNLFG